MDYSDWLRACYPSLMPPKGCPSLYPPKPRKPPKTRKLVKDEICGNIYQSCNGKFEEYWRSIGLSDFPSGSVTVINQSHCTMTVRADTNGDGVPDVTLFTITEKGQTKSASLGTIANLEISCTGRENLKCSGSFCISIHYEKECLGNDKFY